MPIKIYHGPPGSYKTSSMLMEDLPGVCCSVDPESGEERGRVLVTNVRGLTEERVRENYPGKIARGFSVINLRQNDPDDVERMRRWWQWVPFGSYIMFDEVQGVYPPNWTASEFRKIDMPEERNFPNGEPMPRTCELIFDMHRHGNWDMSFATPNIKKVRSEIRGASECAYKHKNLAILGVRGRFAQSMHLAEDNGNASDMYATNFRKVKKWVFACYDSTATGAVKDSKTGRSIFANPRLLFVACFLLGAIWMVSRHPVPDAVRAATGGHVETARPMAGASAAAVLSSVSGQQGSGSRSGGSPLGYSRLWRIVGRIDIDGQQLFLLASAYRVRRVFDGCSRRPDGWVCTVSDGIATDWSGPDPISETYVPPKDQRAGA